ncbi:MAG: macro domain-containing protein [Oscillospiraceae bacterium]|nr:macro domain-containing protein [Oscillospiraceae bacterium]
MKTRICVLRGDITKQKTDAIVNAANCSLLGGGGVDGAIHRAAGPELLASCYRSCLELASANGCRTVAFPSISTGVYHFPLDRASAIAIETIAAYLAEHDEIEQVSMVCFDEKTERWYREALARLEERA